MPRAARNSAPSPGSSSSGRSGATFEVTHHADGSNSIASPAKAIAVATPTRRAAATKASAKMAEEQDEAEEEEEASDSELSDASTANPAPAKKTPRKRKTPAAKKEADAADAGADGSGEPKTPAKKRAKKEPKAPIETHINAQGVEVYTLDDSPARRNKRGALMKPLVHKVKAGELYEEGFTGPIVLHPVEERDFAHEGPEWRRGQAFTGRLGYACLNTILRSAKPEAIFSSRTCRIKSLQEKGMEWVHELARQNVRDIVPMLEWNAKHGIRFMRLSSEMFPFASHAEHGYSPVDVAGEELKRAGDKAKELGIRVTMHPGQFTQLGSPKPGIIEAGIRELKMHTEILDGMGIGPDGVLIV